MEAQGQLVKRGLSTFDIKVLGIVLMVIDHIHQMFAPVGAPLWLDWFGRPVATIFFFVSVIGFSHTHNKRGYMLRLYISMVVTAVLMMVTQRLVVYDAVQLINNIFRDLFIGTVFMAGIDQFQTAKAGHKAKHILAGLGLFLLPFVLSIPTLMLAAIATNMPSWVLPTMIAINPAIMLAENTLFVLLVPILYLLRNHRIGQCLAVAAFAAIAFVGGTTQWMMVFAIIPMLLFDGRKGPGMKTFFYVFYPAHIIVLYLLAAMLH